MGEGVTVTVNVTCCPATAELSEAVSAAVVAVGTGFTVSIKGLEVDVLKAVLPS